MLGNIFSSYSKNDDLKNAKALYKKINPELLPCHTAIIMDGNGRWANGHGFPRTSGHSAGVKTLKNILHVAVDISLPALTVYAFSTENWKRPHSEVDFLMNLFSDYLEKEINEMDENNVRLRFLGRIDELSPALKNQARAAENQTKNNTGLKFNVAMNYGGQDEIMRATQKIGEKIKSGELNPSDINNDVIESCLDTAGLPAVDFIIRTSGDLRISNFLLWQSAYAEFYFTDVNWPDFTPSCFIDALVEFGKRDRRFGGLINK